MQKNRIQWILGILFLGLMGCSTAVEMDTPPLEVKPVVNCLFTPDEPFRLHVSLPASMLATALPNVDDAVVTLSSPTLQKVVLASQGRGFYSDSTLYPQPGELYTVRVWVSGFEVATASDSIPSNVSEWVYQGHELNTWFDSDGHSYGSLSFDILDQAGTNFYDVIGDFEMYDTWDSTQYTDYSIGRFKLLDSENDLQNSYSLFDDQLFDQKKHRIRLFSPYINWIETKDSIQCKLHILQGSEAYYKFQRTALKHTYAQQSDFLFPMEPVNMYSNIQNGYGVFAGFASTQMILNFKPTNQQE